MKTTIKQTLPETVTGLELFIKECEKEVNKFNGLMTAAKERLDIKLGNNKATYGLK